MAYAIAQFDATDEAGNLLTDVTVEVRRESGGLQSVFADRDGTIPLGSRFVVASGRVEFFAPGNAYRIRLTKADYVRDLRFFAIGLASESDMVIRNFRGEWAADETYRTFEMVTHNGLGFFVSTIEENLDNEPDAATPSSTEQWTFWQQEAPTGWKSVALMTVTGGTADAVTAVVEAGIDPASVVMYVINPVSANTGPVTINGVELLAFDGSPLGAGYLQPGAPVLFEPVDSDYRLVMDHRFQVLADAAQQSADDAAETLEDLTSLWLGRFADDAAASAAAGVAVGGQIYWNTTAGAFRYWNGIAWADIPYATVADGFVTAAKISNDAGERDAIRVKIGAAGAELEFTVSQIALILADANNQAQFLGPNGNRFADSFDALTYVDVAGGTNLDTSSAGVLKPTFAGNGNDSFTKVLLHLDGTDGSTTFADDNVGSGARTWTATGAAQLDTGVSPKFGTASALFNGTGAVTTPDSADFDFGTGDFTVDFWFNTNGVGNGTARHMMGQSSSAANTISWYFSLTAANQIGFFVTNNGSAQSNTTTASTVTTAGWNHVAVVRSAGTITVYLNGVASGTPLAYGAIYNSPDIFAIGGVGAYTVSQFVGLLDEVRISKGIARWTSNFSPPSAAYAQPSPNNLTVRSAAFTAAAVPTKMKALINVKEVDAAVAGTDYTLECSRDSGTTWTAMALTERYTMPTSGLRVVEAAETSVTAQPSGSAPRWRFKTLNNKNVELHDVYLYWS